MSDEWYQRIIAGIGRYSRYALQRLYHMLDRTERGYKVDLRTPLFDKAPREEIASELEKAIGTTGFDDFDAIDAHEREKLGPFSIMVPFAKRRDKVEEYTGGHLDADLELLEQCVQEEMSVLPQRSLRALSPDAAYEAAPRGHRLRGAPWFTTDASKDMWYRTQANSVRNYLELWPYTLGWRGQANGTNTPKQRTVAMSTKSETYLSSRVLYPVINALAGKPGFAAWSGPDAVDLAVTEMLKTARGRPIISGDFESFDATVPRLLLDAVKRIRQYWYGNEDVSRIYDIITDYLARGPILVPGGLMWEDRNGAIASGHVCTNDYGGGVNRLAHRYVAKRAKVTVVRMETLGDDSITLFSDEVDPKSYAKFLAELGLVANPDKQFISSDACHFLQNWHSLRYQIDGVCRGVRSPMRILNNALSFERWHGDWSKWMVSVRLGLQCNNAQYHPKFREFVRFMKKGDTILSTGVDFRVVLKKAGGAEQAREVLGIGSFPFNRSDPRKVDELAITRVLRELRT